MKSVEFFRQGRDRIAPDQKKLKSQAYTEHKGSREEKITLAKNSKREPKVIAQLSVIHNNPFPGPHTLRVLVTHMLDNPVFFLE